MGSYNDNRVLLDDIYDEQSTGSNSVGVPDRGGLIQQTYEGVRSLLNWNPLVSVATKGFKAGVDRDPVGYVEDVADNVKTVSSRIPEKIIAVHLL